MIENAQDLFRSLEKEANADGAHVELVLADSESFSVNYDKGELSKYSFDQSLSAGVRVLYGKGAGFSTTEKISEDSLKESYREALRSAKDLHQEAKADKADQKMFKPTQAPKEMSLVSPDIEKVSIEEKMQIAKSLESIAIGYDTKIQNVPYSRYGESKSHRRLMNSMGLNVSTDAAGVYAYTYLLAKQGEDSKSGGYSTFARKPQMLSADKIAKEAARRALDLLGATQPKSGTYQVVFHNEVVAKLIDFLVSHLSAKELDEGTSLFRDKEGQAIISSMITIVDDPFKTEMGGARPFDSEGAASQTTTLIENGVLRSYMTNSHLAEKMNLPHTANASRDGGEMGVSSSNTILMAGTASVEDMLKSSEEVILITAVDALHSGLKPTTLDFSLPAYGFLYRNGEKVKPLHQMVVSGNLIKLFSQVETLGRRTNQDGGDVLAPDMLISDVSIAGQN
jgi:PmbA protein